MTIKVQDTLSKVRSTHRTNKYQTDTLVVRRGFAVTLATTSDTLTVTLVPIRSFHKLNGAYTVTVSTSHSSARNGWVLKRIDTNTVSLFIPVSAKVGLYRLQDSNSAVPLVVLFNPYSSSDGVYMPGGRAAVHEYVQNEAGRIWRGSARSNSGMPWTYAQFRPRVLFAALDLLDRIAVADRDDPVQVCRQLSALLNSSDRDNGVLMGNWSGEFDGGVSPTAWTGSADILGQYWEGGSKPVKYGQCWVFAGVFTSVLRTLGVPSMPVTNFASAHENKPYNRVIEHYIDEDGNKLNGQSRGSTWNFHVWTMAYMRRPDLSKAMKEHGHDYSGWQAIDGTPQETSDGTYQLGPTPVRAVKYGYNVEFDADFVIGEVNCDRVNFRPTGTGANKRFVEFSRDTTGVGQRISVKAVGRDARQDITDWYKFDEGSRAEREAFRNREEGKSIEPANGHADTPSWMSRIRSLISGLRSRRPGSDELYETVSGKDYVKFDAVVPEKVNVGSDVMYILKLSPGTMGSDLLKGKSVRVTVRVEGTDYTGATVGTIRTEKRTVYGDDLISAPSYDGVSIAVAITAADYEKLLAKGMQTLKIDASALVHAGADTSATEDDDVVQTWADETLVRVDVDALLTAHFGAEVTNINETSEGKVAVVKNGDEFTVLATVTNVTHMRLTQATLRVEAEGLLRNTEVVDVGSFGVGETREIRIRCKAGQKGDRLVVMTLDTKEVPDVARSLNVLVRSDLVAGPTGPEDEDEDDVENRW